MGSTLQSSRGCSPCQERVSVKYRDQDRETGGKTSICMYIHICIWYLLDSGIWPGCHGFDSQFFLSFTSPQTPRPPALGFSGFTTKFLLQELLPADLGNFENTKSSGNAMLLLLPALKGWNKGVLPGRLWVSIFQPSLSHILCFYSTLPLSAFCLHGGHPHALDTGPKETVRRRRTPQQHLPALKHDGTAQEYEAARLLRGVPGNTGNHRWVWVSSMLRNGSWKEASRGFS
jgi:hypothetical protein